MAISYGTQENKRPVKSPRREFRNTTAASDWRPMSPALIDSQLRPSNPQDSKHLATASSYPPSFSGEPRLRPISTATCSPGLIKQEDGVPHFLGCLRAPLKRKAEGDGDHKDVGSFSLPSLQTVLPPQEYSGNSTPAFTPDSSPEPSESGRDDINSRHPSAFHVQDPITAGLNQLRLKQNKEPLPPFEALCTSPGYPNQATSEWPIFQHAQGEPSLQHSPPREIRRRRTNFPKSTHCNLKYTLEELDYIRYMRVDCGMKWEKVQDSFRGMFPMTKFPEPRRTQGLQGVNYRQNKALPHIRDGELVFMPNGHVEAVCVQTRVQTERRHCFTLIYLFPERAMNYVWIPPAHRELARRINEARQEQMERARLAAIEAGLYIEQIPSDHKPCACCPAEDRERDPERFAEIKSSDESDELTSRL